jgi:hypothetical protein
MLFLKNISLTLTNFFSLSFRAVTKLLKSALKPSKEESSPPPVPPKIQPPLPTLQSRPSATQQQTTTSVVRTNSMSKSMTGTNNESPQIINSDSTHELLQTKPSMSTSSYGTLASLSNKDEQKETNQSAENLSSPAPPVLFRTGKAALGPRVLPAIDPNGEAPPVKLRPLPSEKKGRDFIEWIGMFF